MKIISSKIPYYTPLFGIYGLTLLAFISFPTDHTFQKAVVVAAGIAHVTWGIIYHTIHKDITSTLILEYIAIAVIGVASVLTIL